MRESIKVLPWANGVDNRSDWRRVREGFARNIENYDVGADGALTLRADYELVLACANARAAFSVGQQVVVADGEDLIAYNTGTDTHRVIASIPGAGRVSGTESNGELFVTTTNQTLRYDGDAVREWGVPTVTTQPAPTIGTGALVAGTYRYAFTLVRNGTEGATGAFGVISVPEGSSLVFTLPEYGRLYITAQGGSTGYMQHEGAGAYVASRVDDSGARLATQFMDEPLRDAAIMTAANGVIFQAAGRVIWHTAPMRPHLREPSSAFFQYPAEVTDCLAVEGDGVYVNADCVYLVSGIGTDAISQRQVKGRPEQAIPGSMTLLPDGRPVWVSHLGLVTASAGVASLLSSPQFAPQDAASASVAAIDFNGKQTVVSALRGAKGSNPLAATDYYEGEVITP
ncbi:hypothetical protein [Pseudomonas sp.]|uniref:hypothetical protein n=1 Tax=Pseudomonas sp. TaxID=306 RepID=UPI004053BCD0